MLMVVVLRKCTYVLWSTPIFLNPGRSDFYSLTKTCIIIGDKVIFLSTQIFGHQWFDDRALNCSFFIWWMKHWSQNQGNSFSSRLWVESWNLIWLQGFDIFHLLLASLAITVFWEVHHFLHSICKSFCAHSQESSLAGGPDGPFWLTWQVVATAAAAFPFLKNWTDWIHDLLWHCRTQTLFHLWASFLPNCRFASVTRKA